MENSRRKFLKVAGASALGMGMAGTAVRAIASGSGNKPKTMKNDNALTAKHWGMVIDTRKFKSHKDVQKLIDVCHKTHNVPDFEYLGEHKQQMHEIKWMWEEEYKHAFTDLNYKYVNKRVEHLPFLVLCNHCENPPCVKACPTKATFKRDDGIVLMDFHRCIGCRFCMAACPYGSRSFNFRDPRAALNLKEETVSGFPTRMKGVVEKCNFCAERLAIGKKPACVEASNGAIAFGDLEDPESDVRKLLESNYTIRRKQGMGTEPSVYYIV